jgi:hypothetical protein
MKINLNVDAYQDEDGKDPLSASKRPKLASARHTRPPKGINNLCGAGSKAGDSQGRQLQHQNDPSSTSNKKQAVYNYISGKKN